MASNIVKFTNISDQVRYGGIEWTPSEITTSAWFDASDTDTITDVLGSISQWSDKSGNGNNATQGVGSNQPTTGGSIGGLNAISFDYTSVQYFLTPLEQLTTTSIYVVMDATQKPISNNSCPLSAVTLGFSTGGLYWTVQQFGTQVNINTVFYTSVVSLSQRFLNGQNITTHGFDPSIISHQGTGFSTENQNYTIGNAISALNTTNSFSGLIGEIIIAPEDHDTETRQKIEGYLAHKWGLTAKLPSNHPYKINPPLRDEIQ
jgi:hypothetical protein